MQNTAHSNSKNSSTYSYKEILAVALPLMIGGISESISSVVDTIFVGSLGKEAIDSVGLTSVLMLLTMMIGWGAGRSVQIMMSKKYGSKEYNQIGTILINGLYFIIPIAILVATLLYLLSNFLSLYLVNDAQIAIMSGELIKIRSKGLPIVMLIAILNSFWVSIGKTKTILIAQLSAAFSNILFNYIFVFGVRGVLAPLGCKGSAWATVYSEWFSLAILLSAFYFQRNKIRVYFKEKSTKLKKELQFVILNLSYPLWIQHFISLGSWLLFFLLIERMGSASLAVSVILKQIFSLVAIPSFALANTSNSLVARLIGMNQIEKIIPTIHKIAQIGTLVLILSSLLLFIFRDHIFLIFTKDIDIINLSIWPLIMLLASFLILPYSNITFNSILAFGFSKVNILLEFTTIAVYTLYMIIIIYKLRLNLIWAWSSELFYWIILLFFSTLYLKYGNWKHEVLKSDF